MPREALIYATNAVNLCRDSAPLRACRGPVPIASSDHTRSRNAFNQPLTITPEDPTAGSEKPIGRNALERQKKSAEILSDILDEANAAPNTTVAQTLKPSFHNAFSYEPRETRVP